MIQKVLTSIKISKPLVYKAKADLNTFDQWIDAWVDIYEGLCNYCEGSLKAKLRCKKIDLSASRALRRDMSSAIGVGVGEEAGKSAVERSVEDK